VEPAAAGHGGAGAGRVPARAAPARRRTGGGRAWSPPARPAHRAGCLLAFGALNAFGGGWYGLSGARGVPTEWLRGSPFRDYSVPSLLLLVVVGGSFLIAAIAALVAARGRVSMSALTMRDGTYISALAAQVRGVDLVGGGGTCADDVRD
jgi:hypothetical protein